MTHEEDDQATSLGPNFNRRVFVQSGREKGEASFHFESLENIYISYEKWAGLPFMTMDDKKTPVPLKNPFTNVTFPDALTFHGELNWAEDEGSSWFGTAKCIYDFTLANDGQRIESGRLELVFNNGTKQDTEFGTGPDQWNYVLFTEK